MSEHPEPARICVVRHGETDWNVAGVLQGSLDVPLNDRGREQSRAMGDAFAGWGFTHVYASPLRRSLENAAIVAERDGAMPAGAQPGFRPRGAARLGAVAFIHRFGSSLNAHLHFHCVVIDGVFDAAAAGGVVFHAASSLDATTINPVQAQVRRRLLRGFARRGLLPSDDAQAMAQWEHGGGFSVDASVRIAAADRAGRERLLRYCARPPFALDRLRELDPEHLLYESAKPGPGGNDPQILTPLELLDRLAALVPPPRVHRHRYFDVGADGRLPEISVATSTVSGWPNSA